MPQNPQQVLKALEEKQYAPLYFLQGEEPYYIDRIANYIENEILTEAEKSFNLIVAYGKDQTISELLAQARRFPMMAERQVVIMKEAQENPDLKKEECQKLLVNYIKAPQPATLLVFAHKHKTLDGRKPLSKLLDQQAILVTTKKLYDSQVPAWISQYVKEKELNITEKAIRMLQEFVGNTLGRLANEIEKISINLEKGDKIDDEAVQQYIGISKEYNVFELQKALTNKDVLKANQIIQYLAANPKTNPIIPIIALLSTFFSKLLLVHHAKDKTKKNLATVLQVRPYFVDDYLLAAQHYPLQKIIDNINYLHPADLQAKGVDNPTIIERQILKELVFKLIH